jgi:predicted NAD/FAD-dependent oxidoreductase
MGTSWKPGVAAALCLLKMPSRQSSIAIVGGGITGSCAAAELATHFDNVFLFDQGRRGPGGRASHRSVNAADGTVLPDDEILDHTDRESFQFDHGCQFFRADTPEMKTELLPHWSSKGWVAPWQARLGCLRNDERAEEVDFFGIPTKKDHVYIGVGGMHRLPRRILESSNATVHRGTRVSSVLKNDQGKWDIYAITGKAAIHDTKESEAMDATEQIIETVDAVVFTDISSSAESWHRASAGIPDSLRQNIPEKVKIPLFSCMVALSHPIADQLPFDGFTVAESSELWFAARSQSKPGVPQCRAECWTLISTPSFAVDQIRETEMRDPITGNFRPQENSYLNSVPGPALFAAFLDAVKPHLKNSPLPEATYLQAQRWGSGLPAPDFIADDIEEICGTRYAGKLKSSLVYPADSAHKTTDFVADDDLFLYYAGDFCSHRNPGFESAALSGLDVAKHIVASTLA